jgi:hypothetical protein
MPDRVKLTAFGHQIEELVVCGWRIKQTLAIRPPIEHVIDNTAFNHTRLARHLIAFFLRGP